MAQFSSSSGQIDVSCSSVVDTSSNTPLVLPSTTTAPVKDSNAIIFSIIGVIIFVAAVVSAIIIIFRRKHKSNKESAGFENRTYGKSGLQRTVDESVTNLQNEQLINIGTTDQYDQYKVSDKKPNAADCNAEQCYSTIDENYPTDSYAGPYYSIKSVPGQRTEHKLYVLETQLGCGQTDASNVPGNSKKVQDTDFETYDHTNVEDKVLPLNEYSYLRNVDKYATDASETYDKMLVPNVRAFTTIEDESNDETYAVTKF
ncbi:uncharacterized protein LOC127849789 [Dreissena polymorpha]|uniref:uncharacterized protein LOC127849789 n=1 Tax=Dreissena polymorpha TaxID=45954 RepID=UPI0022641025|nr:uncharacterized protein LOC127849789 [Dreissena polymorpha]